MAWKEASEAELKDINREDFGVAELKAWNYGKNSNTGKMISDGAQIASSLTQGVLGVMDDNNNREEAKERSEQYRGDQLKQQKFVNQSNQQQISMDKQSQDMSHDMTIQGVEFDNFMYAVQRAAKERQEKEEKRQSIWKKYSNNKQKRQMMFGLNSKKQGGE